jgi:hypothetical protein
MLLSARTKSFQSLSIVGLLDTVRNRILRFALEIRDELGQTNSNDVTAIPPEKIERSVAINIFGGNNVIANDARVPEFQLLGSGASTARRGGRRHNCPQANA